MYYVLQATTANGVTAQTVFRFDTIEAAKSNHFYFLSSTYANPAVTYALAMILNAVGDVLAKEIYDKPPATEEEVE